MVKISLVQYSPTASIVLVAALGAMFLSENIGAVSTKGAWNIGQELPAVKQQPELETELAAVDTDPAEQTPSEQAKPARLELDSGVDGVAAISDKNEEAEKQSAEAIVLDASESARAENSQQAPGQSVADQNKDILETIVGAPIDAEQAKKNALIETRQILRNLDQQYKQLRKSLETEDAYSEKLGEHYFSYGLLLRQASRYPEAIDAFIDALHINKINNGIYSLQQRAVLKALFDTHFQIGNVEEYEDYLERILWIEGKNAQVTDDTSFKMLTMVGNQYLDRFLRRPIAGQSSVQLLLRAKNHLMAAVRMHGSKPLAEILMPYGELALISFLESRMQPDIDKTASMDDHRLRTSRYLDGRELNLASYFVDSYPEGEAYLKDYLRKAIAEKKPRHATYALISLGDLSSLFKENTKASDYYLLAQEMANRTGQGDILLNSFSEPVALPDFQYSVFREPVVPTRPSVLVPLSLHVNELGRVDQVEKLPPDSEYASYYSRARRAARRLIFRPKFIDGTAVAVNELSHDIRVYKRRKK